jgi:hypothetical protein
MSVEDEIRSKLVGGYTPQQLVQEGYKKSTVYKVFGSIRTLRVPISKPNWVVKNYTFHESRYMPGSNIPIKFSFQNTSPLDLYLYRIGVSTEWMKEMWVVQEVKDLVKSGEQKSLSFLLQIPQDLELGEYELSFGIEGQYLPSAQNQQIVTQWSEPVIIQVKKPLTGIKIFLSHSVQDMSLVRQLERRLDYEGIEVTIAEDRSEPGVLLEEKFHRLIRESTMLLALLTEAGIKSKWVIEEVNYANQINKPIILFKDRQISINSPLEWVEFSSDESPEIIFKNIMEAIGKVQQRIQTKSNQNVALGMGILMLILAILGAAVPNK